MTKQPEDKYLEINRDSWNKRTPVHFESKFYDVKGFLEGKTSLNSIELALLDDLAGKKVLHLQCHFGQDTISLARLGAQCVGVDFSDAAIEKARELTALTSVDAKFICCAIYSLPDLLDEEFDIVFTSYGTIGWLPDLGKWANVISHFLKPHGAFVMADFHPVLWMFDDQFSYLQYSYFNSDTIEEDENQTYTDSESDINIKSITWNHPISDILNSLITSGLEILSFNEYDYSPYNCFDKTIEALAGKFIIHHLPEKIPMVYSIKASKKI